VSPINPADVWTKHTVTPNTDINVGVIDTHVTLACTTSVHMGRKRRCLVTRKATRCNAHRSLISGGR
jgi:hypothetical protein